MNRKKIERSIGIILLFALIGWAFYLHIPSLNDGYLNAGDDHIHVAFSNELKKIWQEEGRPFGWSRLYATGAPIFLLRPPGFYQFTWLFHFLTGLTIEESLKIVVLFGFCLFPLTVFIGARLLGVRFFGSLFAALLSPMGISLWGHTLDAYQHLGVHKQLLAILFFPLAVGAIWQVLKNGRYGLLFAASFAVVFMTHPYIAYCAAILVPLMLIALLVAEPQWNWKRGVSQSILWSIPLILWIGIWLLPFATSQEIQIYNPYSERRDNFDVVVLTTAETMRQYLLGGVLDTTKFAGPFGDNEWGWLSNSAWFRLPVITLLSLVGWLVVTIRPKFSTRAFLALSFVAAIILFIGPDDFPFLEWIPFSQQFQNIHAIFIVEWVAFVLAGIAFTWLFQASSLIRQKTMRYGVYLVMGLSVGFGYGTVIYERTKTARSRVDLRNVYTTNGELTIREKLNQEWRDFENVVQPLKTDMTEGAVAAFPLEHEDSVLYNLLPLMTDRSVFICGFERVGGLYDLLLKKFRTDLRDNYQFQKLFDIRYVVNSPHHRKVKMEWHDSVETLYENKFWELIRVKGDFGFIESIPKNLVGFVGKEEAWWELMRVWLTALKNGDDSIPWIINLTHSGLTTSDIEKIKPFIGYLMVGKGFRAPDTLSGMKRVFYDPLGTQGKKLSKKDLSFLSHQADRRQKVIGPLEFEKMRGGRDLEVFRVKTDEPVTPLVFKRAFYRGWRAEIDHKETTIYRVSPGLQLILVPRGQHFITWIYTGPNNWAWAWIGFLLGFVVAGILLGVDGKLGKNIRSSLRINHCQTHNKPE